MVLAVPLSAQTFRGTILGTFTDPNNAVILGGSCSQRRTWDWHRGVPPETDERRLHAELQRKRTYVVTAQKSGFAKYQVDRGRGSHHEKRVDVNSRWPERRSCVVAPAAQVETTY